MWIVQVIYLGLQNLFLLFFFFLLVGCSSSSGMRGFIAVVVGSGFVVDCLFLVLFSFFPPLSSQGQLRKRSKIFVFKYWFNLKLFVTFFDKKNESIWEEPVFSIAPCCSCPCLVHVSSSETGWREYRGAIAFTWHFPFTLYTGTW